MKRKLVSSESHKYNSFHGFEIAIQIAFIIKFLDIIRIASLDNLIHYIDLVILGFLLLTFWLQRIINKTLFVEKRRELVLSRREKTILGICIILFILVLIFIGRYFTNIISSAKLV